MQLSRRRPWFTLIWMCVLVLPGCTESQPSENPAPLVPRSGMLAPASFQETDLLGTWLNTFTKYHTERLTLTSDHQFVQEYEEIGSNGRRFIGQGTWRLEQRASGCAYMHLEGMRYYYGAEAFTMYGNRFTPGGEPYAFWERCEERRLPMPDKVILIVADRPTWPRGIGLVFPATSEEPTDSVSLILETDRFGQPVARPTQKLP